MMPLVGRGLGRALGRDIGIQTRHPGRGPGAGLCGTYFPSNLSKSTLVTECGRRGAFVRNDQGWQQPSGHLAEQHRHLGKHHLQKSITVLSGRLHPQTLPWPFLPPRTRDLTSVAPAPCPLRRAASVPSSSFLLVSGFKDSQRPLVSGETAPGCPWRPELSPLYKMAQGERTACVCPPTYFKSSVDHL